MEMNFYQIDDIIYKSMAPLLLKAIEEEKKVIIYCKNPDLIEEIDNGLWSFSKTKYLPHCTNNDDFDFSRQPIVISNTQENINKAEYLVMLDEIDDSFLKSFDRIFYFFNQKELENAREAWSRYKKESFSMNFYKKENKSWIKVQ